MANKAARSIAEVIPLDPDSRAWMRNRAMPAYGDDAFLTEVSSRYALENPAPTNPANRASRVLCEIALLFGAIGALIFIIWALLPGGITP